MNLLVLVCLLMACSMEDGTDEESRANVEIGKLDLHQEEDSDQLTVVESEEEEVTVVNSNFVGIDQIVHESGAIVTFDGSTGVLLGVILPEDCDKDATLATLEIVRDVLGENNEQFLAIQEVLVD